VTDTRPCVRSHAHPPSLAWTRATHTHPVANTSHGRSGANDCTQMNHNQHAAIVRRAYRHGHPAQPRSTAQGGPTRTRPTRTSTRARNVLREGCDACVRCWRCGGWTSGTGAVRNQHICYGCMLYRSASPHSTQPRKPTQPPLSSPSTRCRKVKTRKPCTLLFQTSKSVVLLACFNPLTCKRVGGAGT
jgi:hypothetical protein